MAGARGSALDVAAGTGRHSRVLLGHGMCVTALDRDPDQQPDAAGLTKIAADLEAGGPWPLAGERFDLVVVTNYLHRPILPEIVGAVAPGGLLLYETFALGNERFGKPSNPDFLLRPGELAKGSRGAAGSTRVRGGRARPAAPGGSPEDRRPRTLRGCAGDRSDFSAAV